MEEIIQTLQKADKIIADEREDVEYFFRYFKHKNSVSKFLKVIVIENSVAYMTSLQNFLSG